MKKYLLLAMVTVLAASSCGRVTPEQRIQKINEHFASSESEYSSRLESIDQSKKLDYISLQLDKLNATEVWTLDAAGGTSVVADFKGRGKDVHYSLISACLDDNQACSVVLDIMNALKTLKIRPNFTIRTVFYNSGDSTGTAGLKAVFEEFDRSMELSTFDIEVSSLKGEGERIFVIEDKPMFVDGVKQVMPPYFEPIGSFSFVGADYPNHDWPGNTPTYRYHLGSNRAQDAAAITAFAFLLN